MYKYFIKFDLFFYIEEENLDSDQMPVAKKYEMLGDRDATKLKLELDGGNTDKHREKKRPFSEMNVATVITTDVKDADDEKEDKTETSNSVAKEVDTALEVSADQPVKDSATTSELSSSSITYDPNVAIGWYIYFL